MARHRGLFPSPPPGSAILVHYFVFSKVVPSRYTRNQSRNHDRKPAPVENDKVKSSGRLLLALDLFLLSSLPSLKNRPLAIFSVESRDERERDVIKNGRNKGLTSGDVAAGPFIGCLGGRCVAADGVLIERVKGGQCD